MIIRDIFSTERHPEQAHEGCGIIGVYHPLTNSDFFGPCHFIDYAVLPPGTSIGLHRHGQDEEIYLIIDGEGIMTIDEEQYRVAKGDLILNKPHGKHGLLNDSNCDLCIFVVEIGLAKE